MRALVADLLDPARDLLLGSSCLGCERPGRLVCRACSTALAELEPAPAWPTPVPSGLVQPWAAAAYEALPRQLVLGLKERGLLSLVAPQARMLAATLAAYAVSEPAPGVLVLVPVPSRRRTVRSRGHDAIGAVTAAAAVRLRAVGVPARAVPLLRLRPGVVDQAGLGATARHANLHGSMWCPGPGVRRLARSVARDPLAPVRVVICDDVITTGSTLREAQRALQSVGLPVVAAAAVAATRRRSA